MQVASLTLELCLCKIGLAIDVFKLKVCYVFPALSIFMVGFCFTQGEIDYPRLRALLSRLVSYLNPPLPSEQGTFQQFHAGCRRWRSNPSGKSSQEWLTRSTNQVVERGTLIPCFALRNIIREFADIHSPSLSTSAEQPQMSRTLEMSSGVHVQAEGVSLSLHSPPPLPAPPGSLPHP